MRGEDSKEFKSQLETEFLKKSIKRETKELMEVREQVIELNARKASFIITK